MVEVLTPKPLICSCSAPVCGMHYCPVDSESLKQILEIVTEFYMKSVDWLLALITKLKFQLSVQKFLSPVIISNIHQTFT